MAGLTGKQAEFVEQYLIDFNATQAAIRAGYSEKTARSQGQRLLTNVDIQEALAQRRQELADANGLTPEKIIAELVLVGFARMDTYVKWGPHGVCLISSDELPEGAAAAVSEVSETVGEKSSTVKFKLHDKKGSLVELLKYLEWKQETADLEARIKALEERIELAKPSFSNGKGSGYPLLQR